MLLQFTTHVNAEPLPPLPYGLANTVKKENVEPRAPVPDLLNAAVDVSISASIDVSANVLLEEACLPRSVYEAKHLGKIVESPREKNLRNSYQA
ncbi:DNA topoisomerase [Paenibacillus sp. NAIST15-1]|nr:DNA topoisomerase [Paenibacillus sp. NAIST15-1]